MCRSRLGGGGVRARGVCRSRVRRGGGGLGLAVIMEALKIGLRGLGC